MTKYLFAIDLDGTLLNDSGNSKVSDFDREAINRAREAGHIICLVTGRPWRSTRKTYEELNLNTVVANYNGAQIHNPSDYDFNPVISYMNLNDVMYILGDKKLKDAMSNLAIEGPGWVMLEKRDVNLESVFGFKDAAKLKLGLDFHRLPLKPTGVIFDTKVGVNVLKLKDYLQRTYGDLVEFSSWSKGENLTPVFDMTNVGVTKAKAISLMARYYDIPINKTIAIGDGYNDLPMFDAVEFSVAMKNSSPDIQEKATHVSEFSNKESGVGHFITKFLDDEGNVFKKYLSAQRRLKKKIVNNTVEVN